MINDRYSGFNLTYFVVLWYYATLSVNLYVSVTPLFVLQTCYQGLLEVFPHTTCELYAELCVTFCAHQYFMIGFCFFADGRLPE